MEIRRFYREIYPCHIGTIRPSSYLIPFEKGADPFADREQSDRFFSLNGEWAFGFYPNVERLPLEEAGFPAGLACPDRMEVPGCWQLHTDRGYDPPQYLNQDYPYPVDPPHLPDVIPCGLYRRQYALAKKPDRRYRLVFEGVSSCFYLWVNGSWIGYSQVSHAVSVFDVTDALRDGDNRIEVLVIKHCTGSYMEDQDFFRLSGIFRETYLLERDAACLEDARVTTRLSDDFSEAEISVELQKPEHAAVCFRLRAPDGRTVGEGKTSGDALSLRIPAPMLWSAEIPSLYDLELTCGEEAIGLRIGLRDVRIQNAALTFNGRKIKLRGVNRHDMNPETGYWVTPENMLEDLYVLKRANVNTIRTSHYPNDPRFLRMCDELGFYVIDEADLETHGLGYNYGDWYWDYWAHICDVPEWKDACVDRAALLYERDKNHPCVIMWSLGNESGCGENHRHMAAYIRGRDPRALIHYENARLEYEERVHRDFKDISDVESRMYASLDYLTAYLADETKTKPFFYCEYVSAWSTGDIPLHWDDFEDNDKYCGGCVWEFADHALNAGDKNAPRYRYGGDFGDDPNDFVYCADGLVYPDRSPRPGYADMKDCYKPFRAGLREGKLQLFNKYYFRELDCVTAFWQVETEGVPTRSGSFPVRIPPREGRSIELFPPFVPDRFTTVILSLRTDRDLPWAKKGFEIGREQFLLLDAPVRKKPKPPVRLVCEQTRTDVLVRAGNCEYLFDRIEGRISDVRKGGISYFAAPSSFSVFRSYHPSDPSAAAWERARYESAVQKTYSFGVESADDDSVVLLAKISFAAAAMPPAVRGEIRYTILANGDLRIAGNAAVTENAPPLPRFGLELRLPYKTERMEYLGCGPVETYADRHRSQNLSLYRTTATENFEHRVYPFENGAHYATKRATVTDPDGRGFEITDNGAAGFSFNASHFTDREIQRALHDDELRETDQTVVHVDYKLHAANPGHADREPARSFAEKQFSFSWDLRVL